MNPVTTVTAKDCRWDYFRAGGKGGQAQNKKSTGVRCVHEASGAVGESREERSQLQNRRIAFVRMANSPKFKYWAETQSKYETVEAVVDRQLAVENLLVEVREDGKWVAA